MSSDLPDMRYEDGLAMAKALVTYLDDPRAVQIAVRSEFDCTARGMSLSTIRRLRKAHLESLLKPDEPPHKPHEGHDPLAVSRRLEDANKCFLAALEAERELSEQRRADAYQRDTAWLDQASVNLHSAFLTNPRLVDTKWDKAVDDALWEAGR